MRRTALHVVTLIAATVTASLAIAPVASAQPAGVIRIDPSRVLGPVSPHLTGLCIEDVNHEIYGGLYSQMLFGESFAEPAGEHSDGASGMWAGFRRGGATGTTPLLVAHDPFVGVQTQQIRFDAGSGAVGVENRGLNRQGIGLVAGKRYVGHLWARAASATSLTVALASNDGSHVYASADVSVTDATWKRYDFALTPDTADGTARFEVELKAPGSAELGYAFLSADTWGTFKDLPVREDVAEQIVASGVKAMRYGGSMVNEPTYRWKNTIGDRDRRPPYRGHWYDYSSNGWGIVDFLNFAEAADVLGVPDFNIDESPRDMLDFVEYATGPATSEWGAKRAADGHPEPYHLTHLELGNEERVDDGYWKKFEAIARAVWSKDPKIVLVVGDFAYTRPIVDPFHFDGADSHITTLAAQQKILALAKAFDAEVWFDIHVWTERPHAIGERQPWQTYVDAIDKLADGAKHHVAIFELNANTHDQRRALANAQALIEIERDGRLPFVSSANGLQVDGQNDNGWDQGLIFMNPTKVWMQPTGYAWQMLRQDGQAKLIECALPAGAADLDAVATVSADGKTVTLQAINTGDAPVTTSIATAGWPANVVPQGQTMTADWTATNPSNAPHQVHPTALPVAEDGKITLPQRSISVVTLRR